MRPLWKGSIGFGLVSIPVKMYAATEEKDVKFRYLHKKCSTPLRYQRVCPHCNETVDWEEIVRGYEYEKDRFVILEEEDFAALPGEQNRVIEILDFVDLAEIDPVYFNRSYYLAPAETGEKPYYLLHRAMADRGKIAVARMVIRSRTTLTTVRVYQAALALETMFYPEEVRSVNEVTDSLREVNISENELRMAGELIQNLSASFDPAKYRDEYREALLAVVEGKIRGEQVAVPQPAEPGKVVDLMEALKASVEKIKEEKAPTGRRKKEKVSR